MRLDFHVEALADFVHLSPDALRIRLGRPTTLQLRIRNAATFEQLVGMNNCFEDTFRLGDVIRVEPEEVQEYLARRIELFDTFLERFQTFETFNEFETSLYFTHFKDEEREQLIKRFAIVLEKKIEATGTVKELVNFREVLSLKEEPREGHPAFPVSKSCELIERKIRDVLLENLSATRDLESRIELFGHAAPGLLLPMDQTMWNFAWEIASSTQDVMSIEQRVPAKFLDRKKLSRIMTSFAVKEASVLDSFKERLKLAEIFRECERRDGEPNQALSEVLYLAFELAVTSRQVGELIITWGCRYSQDNCPVPKAFYDKFDRFYLDKARTTKNVKVLQQILKRCGNARAYGSETYAVAERRRDEMLAKKINAALSEKEVDSLPTCRASQPRREELRRMQFRIDAKTSEDLEILKKAFFGLKESDPEIANRVLLKLAPHFPPESIEVM